MILKLGVLIAFLCVNICSATTSKIHNGESYSVENLWKKTNYWCKRKPDWIKPVQKYYDDLMIAFNTFPGQVTLAAEMVKAKFRELLTEVITFSNSDAKILSAGATGILESFARVKIDILSAAGIINEFQRVLPILMEAHRNVITNMTNIIGDELVCATNNAISDLQSEFNLYVDKFKAAGGKKEINYKPVMKCVQKLVNTIKLKGDVKLSNCQLVNLFVRHARVVLSLILNYIIILVHGLSSSSKAVLLERKCEKLMVSSWQWQHSFVVSPTVQNIFRYKYYH
ncbi:hypothetical protein Bhyg_05824 [Pseudolycoriella hygida]|uniref:Uncharacterized protein n=1 Tax=Pseudolycoriella hygida TaxID=35572 RepID=A0A9Q0N0C8_9DIPT|nr:hypothetical protein Bhyg_05824 [Pseudolycoriella hygida]